MTKLWKRVNLTIKNSDLLIVVLDARFIKETMNQEIIEKIKTENKPYFFAVTKTDLSKKIDKKTIPRPYVLLSTTKRIGKSDLRRMIYTIGERHYGKHCSLRVGVLGYPNVGKSSLINMMKGRKSASTSIMSGHTKSRKNIRVEERILLIDTPGVIPFGEKNKMKHLLIGTTDFEKVKYPVDALLDVMRKYPGSIEKYFGVAPQRSHRKTVEMIALKMNMLMKGGVPDTNRVARMIIRKFQKGELTL